MNNLKNTVITIDPTDESSVEKARKLVMDLFSKSIQPFVLVQSFHDYSATVQAAEKIFTDMGCAFVSHGEYLQRGYQAIYEQAAEKYQSLVVIEWPGKKV